MVNLSHNFTAIEFNNTIINGTQSDILPNIVANADTVTGGYFGLMIYLTMFVFLYFILAADQLFFRYDTPRALQISSGLTFILALVMVLTGFTSIFTHVMWFFLLWILTTIWVYLRNKKGL